MTEKSPGSAAAGAAHPESKAHAHDAPSAADFPPRRYLYEETMHLESTEVTAQPGRYQVSAIYPSHREAATVCQRLSDGGIAFCTVDSLHEHPLSVIEDSSDEVLKEVLVDSAIGTAVGTGVGALGTVALWASGVTLFLASPVVATLMMLGYFATAGGIIGAVAGAEGVGEPEPGTPRKESKFSEMVMDAIKAGNVVLVTRPRDKDEAELAKEIIVDSLRGRDEAESKVVIKT